MMKFRHGESNVAEPDEPERRRPATRAFVALCEGGIIVVGISEDPIHLYDLAMLLVSPGSTNRPACYDAVNLSGGGSAALVVRRHGEETPLVWGNVSVRQASLVTFSRR